MADLAGQTEKEIDDFQFRVSSSRLDVLTGNWNS